jgi:hypothetical protein
MKTAKPVETDAHFKYLCPNCGANHWASLVEAKTKGFMIVCHCANPFNIKTIEKIDIVYKVEEEQKQERSKIKTNIDPKVSRLKRKLEASKLKEYIKEKKKQTEPKTLSLDKAEKCVKTLCALGYTKAEARSMIKDAFAKMPIDDLDQLIKYAITNFGVYHV